MKVSNDSPFDVTYAQEKAEWDAVQKEKRENTKYVIVTGLDIPFFKLVFFLAKVAIAAIPAGVIVFIFWSILAGLFVGVMR